MPNKILLDAAELIENIGWTQGRSIEYDEYGHICGYCALGALSTAYYEQGTGKLAKARHMLIQEIGVSFVSEWNDKKEQTKENVIATLRKAAEREEV